MLTEGRDANAVTHILGVRAFGTQLLCEQVVGRGIKLPIATNDTAEGRQQNRRVELIFSNERGKFASNH
jgi:flagellar motor protein MotB